MLSVARLKYLWFSTGVGFSRLSNFREEGEPAISGRIEPSKPTLGSNYVKELPVQESKNGNSAECKAILLGLIAASLVLPPFGSVAVTDSVLVTGYPGYTRIPDLKPQGREGTRSRAL